MGAYGELDSVMFKPGIIGVADEFTKDTVANLVAWFRADKGVTLNGSNVSAWANQADGGSGYDLAQTVAERQPIFTASESEFNNQSVIYFDGTDVLFNSNTGSDTGWTAYVVYKLNATPGGLAYGFAFKLVENWLAWNVYAGSDTAVYNGGGTVLTNHFNTTKYIFKYISNGATSVVQWNAESDQAITNASPQQSAIYLGADNNIVGASAIKIAEVLIFSREITAAEQIVVRNYLNARYSVY